jgi:hypothetical protein
MWSVNDLRSSSLILCVELDPAVPLTAIRPLLVSNLDISTDVATGFMRASSKERQKQRRSESYMRRENGKVRAGRLGGGTYTG